MLNKIKNLLNKKEEYKTLEEVQTKAYFIQAFNFQQKARKTFLPKQ